MDEQQTKETARIFKEFSDIVFTGTFKERIRACEGNGRVLPSRLVEAWVDEAANEFAKAFQANKLDEEMIKKLLATGDIAHENYVKAFKVHKKWFGGKNGKSS